MAGTAERIAAVTALMLSSSHGIVRSRFSMRTAGETQAKRVTTMRYGKRETIVRNSERTGKAKAEVVENKDRNTTEETT